MFDSFGLDISDGSAKYVYIKRGMFGDILEAYGECKIPEGLIINGEIKDQKTVVQFFRDSIKGVKTLPPFAAVSLPDSKTFVKLLTITLPETGDIHQAVNLELAKHIPIPVDQLVIDWSIVDEASRTKRKKQSIPREMRVLVAACESHIVRDYADTLRNAGITPIAFEVEAQSTARSVLAREDVASDLRSATVVIDWGETQATIMFFAGGTLVFNASSEISGREVTRKIAEKLSMDFDQAERAKLICGLNSKKCKGIVRQYLQEYITSLSDEVKKGFEYYTTHISSTGTVQSVLLVGGGSNLKDLDRELERMLSLGVRPLFGDVFRNLPNIRNVHSMPAIKRVSFATAVGLALRTIV